MGKALIMIQQIVFTVMLKNRLITPQQTRELLDGVVLHLETQQADPDPRRGRAVSFAREQVRLLVDVLEETCPEMKANPPSR